MSKKSYQWHINPYSLAAFSMVALVLVFTMCMNILSVDQPTEIDAGETFEVTMQVEITEDDDTGNPFELVVGFLAPRSWNAAQNTTVRFESTAGPSTMRLANPDEVDPETKFPWPDGFANKLSIGENYGEVEWVVFIAETAYPAPNGLTGTVFIETTAGSENVITQLGYGISNNTWGLGADNFDVFFTDCIEIKNGTGSVTNLCGAAPRQLVEQSSFTFDDLITIVYDAKEDNSLEGAGFVYFCSTAHYGNNSVEICDTVDKASMQFVGDDVWNLTFWPPSYYGIPEGESIDFIECRFMNLNGSIVITNLGGDDFVIQTSCFD